MNKSTQEIHSERIDYLVNEFCDRWDDAKHSTKVINQTMWGCFTDFPYGKKYKKSDLTLWLGYGKEKLDEAMSLLNALAEEIDDIEKDLNK